MSKTLKRAICAVLILLNIQTELHSFLALLYPTIKKIDVTPYIHHAPPYKVSLTWWLFLTEQNILVLGLLAIICILARYISGRIFIVCCIYFFYYFVDHLALWYDYKQSHWFYWLMQWCAFISIWLLLKPMKEDKEGAKIKRMF